MAKPKQLQLFKKDIRFFGGRMLHGKRRKQRPLSIKEPIHLVMRSVWATGPYSFLIPRNKRAIENFISDLAKRYFIKVYQKAIAGNHLHLVIKISERKNYAKFIRVLASSIASHVMKQQSFKVFRAVITQQTQERGDPPSNQDQQGKEQQFWQFRPWSRVLYWGRDYQTCCRYVLQNTLEALGFIEYKPRKNIYAKWISSTTTNSS